MDFWKMHGAGNDFIITDNRNGQIINNSQTAIAVCDRHLGIGADGFIMVEESKKNDVRMSFYNSDGSEATMCGNGLRCFAKYVHDNQIVGKNKFTVETGDGEKRVEILDSSEKESTVSINMGKWDFSSQTIGVDTSEKEFIDQDILSEGKTFKISCVHMGVPHGVVFVDEVKAEDTVKYGSSIEKNKLFKKGVNVNFVQIADSENLIVDTWERGAGKTLACGTGVCSSVILANRLKNISTTVNVMVPGGQLKISILPDASILMTGKAVTICKGIAI